MNRHYIPPIIKCLLSKKWKLNIVIKATRWNPRAQEPFESKQKLILDENLQIGKKSRVKITEASVRS